MVRSQALVLDADGAAIREVEVAEPGPGEVLVRVAASGVCATDLHMVEGTSRPPLLPAVMGHEGAGVVAGTGPGVTHLAAGDHVVFARAAPCGACRQCTRGFGVDCDSDAYRAALFGVMSDGCTRVTAAGQRAYTLYGGTLSEWATVRADHLVRIDSDLPLDLVCLIGCAVVTAYGAVFNVAGVRPGDTILVVGCGSVGLNIVQAARLAGAAMIIAVDPVAAKRELALGLGATHTLETGDEVPASIADFVPDGVDVAFEAVGVASLVATCMAATRVGGVTVMVGVPAVGSDVVLPALPLMYNRRVLGCRGGAVVADRDLPRVADHARAGELQLAPLVGERIALADVAAAFDHLRSGAPGRTVVVF